MASRFQDAMRSTLRSLTDPSRRETCGYCEGAGFLRRKSGKRVKCNECDGDGYTLNIADFMEALGGRTCGGGLRERIS